MSNRDRGRPSTRRALRLAASELVLEHGHDITVHQIASRAGVSRRTFFNYFASKDEALVAAVPRLSASNLAGRIAHGDGEAKLMSDIAEALIELTAVQAADHEQMDIWRRISRNYPHAIAGPSSGLRQLEEDLTKAISHRLSRMPNSLPGDASLYALVAVAALKHALTTWSNAKDPGELRHHILRSFSLLPPAVRLRAAT